jgi:pSer/pThr/pTyr-binding forkhead associated (FHA) protein
VTDYRLHFRGTLFPIRGGEVTLGRSSYASIVVNNPLASREHAVIRFAAGGGGLEVVDLGSKNGTFVNGDRVVGARGVNLGDQIKIGTDVIEVSRMSERDPAAHRVATLPGRTMSPKDPEGDTTVNFSRSLELAEQLIATSTPASRYEVADGVMELVNQFWAETGGGKLGPSEIDRMRRLVGAISAWRLGSRVAEWEKQVEARLG